MSGRGRGGRGGRGGAGGFQGHGGGGRSGGGRGGGGRGDRAGGGRGNGGGGRGGGGRGGRGSGPPKTLEAGKVLTNIIPAKISEEFQFYLYSVDCTDKDNNMIDSRSRRAELFWNSLDNLIKDLSKKEQEALKRMVFFSGSFFYAAREIPGLEKSKLPVTLCDGTTTRGDTMRCLSIQKFTAPTVLQQHPRTAQGQNMIKFDGLRCKNCTRTFPNEQKLLAHCRDTGHGLILGEDNENDKLVPSTVENFVAYVNMVMQRAMGENLKKWGKEFVDLSVSQEAVDARGNKLGVAIYQAIALSFGVMRVSAGPPALTLTCDLRAKVIRTTSVLEAMYGGGNEKLTPERQQQQQRSLTPRKKKQLEQQWIGEVVIYIKEKNCYMVTGLDFENSAKTLPVPNKGISHAEYFLQKKVALQFPDAKPMILVEGRRKMTIYLPPELVAGNELDPKVKEMLPQIASFVPDVRNKMIENVRGFLTPGKQNKSVGGSLLPAVGIFLADNRIVTDAKVLDPPSLVACGVSIPKEKSEFFVPCLSRATFEIDPTRATEFTVVVFYHPTLSKKSVLHVFSQIAHWVNSLKTKYRFPSKPVLVPTGEGAVHYGAVEKFFGSAKATSCNLFVLNFTRPTRTALDSQYPLIKAFLAKAGFLSQFVNFSKCPHDNIRDEREGRKSNMILQAVSRQILQKAGVRIWWSEIPKSLPLPTLFLGVDVFHAPLVYNPALKKCFRKDSVAAIICQVVRKNTNEKSPMEIYSKTFSRSGGNEYQLGDALKETVSETIRHLKVKPASVIVWRDGIAESAEHHVSEEIVGVRNGLMTGTVGTSGGKPPLVPLAYIVCQKRISTKLFQASGSHGAPPGTLVTSLQSMQHKTFYLNGRAPPNSTPKPVRFICTQIDPPLRQVPLAQLTWGQCHDYPNWAGPIKVPSCCQMAHKLAELAGGFSDGGEEINDEAYKNRVYFL